VRKNRIFSAIVIFMLCFQFAVGLADVFNMAPVPLQVLHLFGADLLWISLVLLVAGIAAPQTREDVTS
jgi:heme a synthase